MSHETNGAALLDDSSSPSPSPSVPRQSRGPRSLFFSGATETEDLPTSDPGASTSSPSPAGPDASASAGEHPSDPSDEWSDDSLSSSRSGKPLKPLGKAALKASTIQAVLIGSAMAHRVAARTEGQKMVGLYLADEEDAENIGEPISEIMHRRGGIAGAMNKDTNDALQAIMGVANYVSKQVVKAVQAREVDTHLAAGGTLPGQEQAA